MLHKHCFLCDGESMPKRSRKQPKPDINQLAASIVARTTGQTPLVDKPTEKNPAAVALGRLGGLKGGKVRADKLSKEKLVQIAKSGASARWKGHKRKEK